MTARSIGDLIGSAAPTKFARTFQPVRRSSYDTGDRRANRLWKRLAADNRQARRLIAARLQAAEYYNERRKDAGERQGPIGDVGIRLLRELYRIIDFKTGRLEPTIDTLCQRIRRSRATVVKYLAKLKEHGFLDWVRRSETTDNAGAGPQVRQVTNAYGFAMPKHAADFVKRILGNGPAPDCEVAKRAADQAETEAMLDDAGPDGAVDFLVGNDDPQLAELLKKMGSSLFSISASSVSGQNPGSEEL